MKNKSKLHSLKWIANKYNLSIPALYQRIKKINHFQQRFMIKKHQPHRKSYWLIKPAGIQLISYKRHDSRSNNYIHYKSRKGSKNKQPTKNDYFTLAMRLSKQNQQLTQVNLSQQETIKSQTTVINKLRQKNATNQRLLANQCKQKKLPSSRQHGFWWRLFH